MTISALSARRLLGLAVLVPVATVTAACAASPGVGSPHVTVPVRATPSGSITPAGPPACATAALHVKLGASNRVAKATYRNLDFTNVGSATCSLLGYPTVALVSAGTNAGELIGGYAKPDPATSSKQVVLAAGQTAHAQLGHVAPANTPSCHPVTAHWLRIYLPHQTKADYLPFTTRTCAALAALTMYISDFVAGA
jgi:hypothetical protein